MNLKTPMLCLGARRATLRIGFVPLADCAPIVMAHELGLFRKYGLRVAMHRELGWATVRDKIIHGELDASHALAAMPFAATLGLGSIPCECLAGLVLNLHGNAITLSNDLWKRQIRSLAALRQEIIRMRHQKVFTFGTVSLFSSHYYLLRHWLISGGINPDRDVRIVVVPPRQMPANLKAGHLDGFCVGEPWNSVTVQMGIGWCAAASAELEPGHPEKVLMVRRDFAEQRHEEHIALLSALLEACSFCDAPENRKRLVATLARASYVDAPVDALQRAFSGHFDFGHGHVRAVRDFTVFHRNDANDPSAAKAAWVLQLIRAGGQCKNPAALNFGFARTVFRPDFFDHAVRLRSSTPHIQNHEEKKELTLIQ